MNINTIHHMVVKMDVSPSTRPGNVSAASYSSMIEVKGTVINLSVVINYYSVTI